MGWYKAHSTLNTVHKAILIIFFGLLWCNVGFAETYEGMTKNDLRDVLKDVKLGDDPFIQEVIGSGILKSI